MKYAAIAVVLLAAGAGLAEDAPEGPKIRRHLNLPYHKVDGVDPNLLSLDIYAPEDARDLPVMVMIHGGGWAFGDKANRGLIDRKIPFFASRGWVLVSVNYRLSPKVQHPVHVEDVARALAWLGENVGKYGGDAKQIYLMGHSAGAHLAALVAIDGKYLQAHGRKLSMLKGVVLLDGAGYDIPTHLQSTAGPMLKRMYVRAFTDDAAKQRQASPISHVAPGKDIPPFLIIHVADREASRKQSEALAKALVTAKVPARTFAAEGENHGSVNRDFGRKGHKLTAETWSFLRKLRQDREQGDDE